MLSDLNFAGTGNQARCYYWSNTDSLVVSFVNVPFWYPTGNFTGYNTFQFVCSKLDKSITINYRKMNMGLWASIDAITGIENVTGTLGLECFTDSLPPDSTCIKFTYPSVVTYQVRDVGINWNLNSQNGGIFVKKGGAAMPLTANVKNFGNQTITNITVYDTVYNSTGGVVTNGSTSISTLTPGQTVTVMFSDSFSAPNAQTYTLRTRTDGVVGDMVPANNSSPLEIISVDTTVAPMNLDYSDGQPDGAGINWTGGGGGMGVYIEPPFYPAKIKDMRFYITATGTPAPGFYSIILDDNGPGRSPGTVLDSVFVSPGNIVASAYKVVSPGQSIIIDSGGVYLYWKMGGAGIAIGRDINLPISRRTYEVLGGAWSGYRSMLFEDVLMGIRVIFAYPNADFTFNMSADPNIVFTDKSTNQPTQWLWNFGDGATDTLQNPSHTFADNDTFYVCLTASNQYGSDSVCKKVIIDGNVPTADFILDDTLMPFITFYDQSTNSPTAWFWDFDASPSDTSDLQNTAFKYLSNGVFNVCLTAKNQNGSSIPVCKDVEITGIGLGEFSGARVEIFPNPMRDFATIRLSKHFNPATAGVKLYDMSGRTVQVALDRNGSDFHIYKSGLAPGQYIAEITSDGQVITRLPLQVSEN